MIFDLVKDFAAVLDAMPEGHPRRRILALLDEAIRRDVHFIDRHPTTFFQCMWNTCWWEDSEAMKAILFDHYTDWRRLRAADRSVAAWAVFGLVLAGAGAIAADRGWVCAGLGVGVYGLILVLGAIRHWRRRRNEGRGGPVSALLEEWRAARQAARPGLIWLRALRPPETGLGGPFRLVLPHDDQVYCVAVFPDGRRVVSGSQDRTARVWNLETSTELLRLRGHEGTVSCVAVSLDGTRIVTGCGRQLRIWHAESGSELNLLRPDEQPLALSDKLTAVVFAPDGERIFAASGNIVTVWDAARGEAITTLRGHEKEINDLAVAPDGRRIATASADQTVRLWDAATGQELRILRGYTGEARAVAFSADGSKLVTGSWGWNESIRVWDVETGAQLVAIRGDPTAVETVCFSPDGRSIASGGTDHIVKLWDWQVGPAVNPRPFVGHNHWVKKVAFTCDGRRLVSASWDGTVRAWDLTTRWGAGRPRLANDVVQRVGYSPDGSRVLTLGRFGDDWATQGLGQILLGKAVRIELGLGLGRAWDAETGSELFAFGPDGGPLEDVTYSPDGRRIAGIGLNILNDNVVTLFDAATGTELATLRGHEHWVSNAAFSPDGSRLATGSLDKTVRFWDVTTGRETTVIPVADANDAASLTYSPDGIRVVGGRGHVWDATTGEPLGQILGAGPVFGGVVFSPDGRWVAVARESTVTLRAAADGTEVRVLHGRAGRFTCVAFSPDGRRVAAAAIDGGATVWDVAGGEVLETVRGESDLAAVAAGPTLGRRPVARDRETVLEETAAGKPITYFPGALAALAVRPGGRTFAGLAGFHGGAGGNLTLLAIEGDAPAEGPP